jgi:prophage antirepressor-like protein
MSNFNPSNAVSLLDFNAKQVRVVNLNNAKWFIAADVCKILGLSNASMSIANAAIAPDEQSKLNLGSGGETPDHPVPLGCQQTDPPIPQTSSCPV